MIEFTLPFPPSVNQLYPTFNKRRVKSKKYKAWLQEAGVILNKQSVPIMTERCAIVYELYSPDKRQRDAGNYEKAVTDFLVGRGILQGDSSRYVKGVFTFWNDIEGQDVKVKLFRDIHYFFTIMA